MSTEWLRLRNQTLAIDSIATARSSFPQESTQKHSLRASRVLVMRARSGLAFRRRLDRGGS